MSKTKLMLKMLTLPIRKILKMVDYEDGLKYENLKLCFCYRYRPYRLNPLRTQYKGLFSGVTTTRELKSTLLTRYIKLDKYTYKVLGFRWM